MKKEPQGQQQEPKEPKTEAAQAQELLFGKSSETSGEGDIQPEQTLQSKTSEQDIEYWKNKAEELDSLYRNKMVEISQVQKNLEPLIGLQEYLRQHPDKAQQIAKILLDEQSNQQTNQSLSEDTLGIADDNVYKNLKKEIDSLKNLIVQNQFTAQQVQQQQLFEQQVKQQEQIILQMLDQYKQSYGDDFDEEKFIARMSLFDERYLDNLSDSDFKYLSDKVAEELVSNIKQKNQQKFDNYLKTKKDIATKTKTETGSTPTGSAKKEFKVSLDDDSAKNAAIEYLKKFQVGG